MNKTWTTKEADFLTKHAGKITDSELSKIMTDTFKKTFTVDSIRHKRKRLGLTRTPNGKGLIITRPIRTPRKK